MADLTKLTLKRGVLTHGQALEDPETGDIGAYRRTERAQQEDQKNTCHAVVPPSTPMRRVFAQATEIPNPWFS